MNSFPDAIGAQRAALAAISNNKFSETINQQSHQQQPQTLLNQQQHNSNHSRVHPDQNPPKNSRKKSNHTYQTGGKKRNYSTNSVNGSNNSNSNSNNIISNGGKLRDRNYNHSNSSINAINNNTNSNNYKNVTNGAHLKNSLDEESTSNSVSSDSININSSGGESNNKNNNNNISSKSVNLTDTMNLRLTNLSTVHSTQQHNPLPSPTLGTVKAIYTVDYVHQVGAQMTARFRPQRNDFFFGNTNNGHGSATNTSNTNRLGYSNSSLSNGGLRYSSLNSGNGSSNIGKYSNHIPATATQTNCVSISPPLSIASSGSSNHSGNSYKNSKSYSKANSMNQPRSISQQQQQQQQQHQQQYNTNFQHTQKITFYHGSNTVQPQQLYHSSSNGPQHSQKDQVKMFQQQTSPLSFHQNNNYHCHNRNYQNNAYKKTWNNYNNNRYKHKNDVNGNYSSNSSNSSTNSNGKYPNATSIAQSKKDQALRSVGDDKTSIQQQVTRNQNNRVETATTNDTKESSVKSNQEQNTFESSDYENQKMKSSTMHSNPMSNNNQTKCEKSKKPLMKLLKQPSVAQSISPSLSISPPAIVPNADSCLTNSTMNRTVSSTDSNSFLLAIDKEMLVSSPISHVNEPTIKTDKNTYNRSDVIFPHGQQSYPTKSTNSNGTTMLTEEMLLSVNGVTTKANSKSFNRIRHFNTQQNILLCDPPLCQSYPMLDFYNSPGTLSVSQSFSFPDEPHQKRRSPTPGNRPNRNTGQNRERLLSMKNSNEFENYMHYRYTARTHWIELKTAPETFCNGSKWDQISKNIWAKSTSRQQTEATYRKKMLLWSSLCTFIKNMPQPYPYSLYLVGSTISGFALDTSDVDMCLVTRAHTKEDPRSEALWHLQTLKGHLQCKDNNISANLTHFNLIHAKVPILRFDDTLHNVEVDLNYKNCVGIRNSHLLYCYTQMDWRLRPLALIVKIWAQFHYINNAKDMTISSYSLILMVIHFLQCAVQPPVLPCLHAMYPDKFQRVNDINTIDMSEEIGPYHSDNTQTLGELFLQFLEYYSNFNYDLYAISVRTAGLLPIEQCRTALSYKNDPNVWRQLCIEEPFDLSNTARSCYDEKIFERIKSVFIRSWHVLRDTMDLDKLFDKPFLSPPPQTVFYDNLSMAVTPTFPFMATIS